jgi:phosphoribosylformylglycinamidine synthase
MPLGFATYYPKVKTAAMLWEVDIYAIDRQHDRLAAQTADDARDLELGDEHLGIVAGEGYLIEGEISREDAERAARELFCDAVVERAVVAPVGDAALAEPPLLHARLVHVLPKPGVMDPVAQSAQRALHDLDIAADVVRTMKKYWVTGLGGDEIDTLCDKVLANDAIERVVLGPLAMDHLDVGTPYTFELKQMPLCELNDDALVRVSREGQLSLSLEEMRAIQEHYRTLDREPTDAELETIAQTWSEHCSHKTLAGRIHYVDDTGERHFDNMLKETIFAATQKFMRDADDNWCVSVFEDNAGIIRFDDEYNVVFKVETHNHPSAIEPYGGSNTGIGGVVRDPIGTGLGARPVCNTNVFCFARPDTPAAQLPPGVLHPKRIMRGVVSGVRDYGNRMGIPTVNGALFFDERYVGNPLVYCGTVGMIPRDRCKKEPQPGDHVVVVGGRTGRDGIHGATFSSIELTAASETTSGGAVQIGNAITEKMLLDVILKARDAGLYSAITDCGAGGLSSAVGEMGEKVGATVWLDRAPLKYHGLSYTEIWISEAQERMVLSVPPKNWPAFESICAAEGVEATVIGQFEATGRLRLLYDEHEVADLDMHFLHDGRPPVVREAVYQPAAAAPLRVEAATDDLGRTLLEILGSPNVASKEWVIRQYDHEVQGGSVVKPLVGVANDGPSDAAVIRPRLSSRRGLVISNGMNPRYGDLDPYHMAASAIDEAVRNCVAVGADPARIAILDNFCWGNTQRAETLGSLVRAALACHDLAIALGTPFISGKDSLNNEYHFDHHGTTETISIPASLLISALGQVEDVATCVTMDLKAAGNLIYQVGATHNELGGSHYALVTGATGGAVPHVNAEVAKRTFAAVHRAIRNSLVRSCHDLSEGGLAVAAAEMAFAGALGAALHLDAVPNQLAAAENNAATLLMSESNSRFLCEVCPDDKAAFEAVMTGVPCGLIGRVSDGNRLRIVDGETLVVDVPLDELKRAWQAPFNW